LTSRYGRTSELFRVKELPERCGASGVDLGRWAADVRACPPLYAGIVTQLDTHGRLGDSIGGVPPPEGGGRPHHEMVPELHVSNEGYGGWQRLRHVFGMKSLALAARLSVR
jgi:hypothetical protein